MIDLHSHILPGLDDGADSLEISMEMARAYVDQGVKYVACTPHILPGLYNNRGEQIRQATKELQQHLSAAGIPLHLVSGADNYIVPDFVSQLRDGHLLTLADTRYVLIEPPHQLAPIHLERLFFDILAAEYVPILTHPERLGWIESDYRRIQVLAARGVWIQITSGSLLGRFGKRARYWGERMLSEGLVHILATDAHDTSRRPPDLLKGRLAAEKCVGAQIAQALVETHPMTVLSNMTPTGCIVPQSNRSWGKEDYAKIRNDRGDGGLVKRLCQFFS
jgi:protein-tyrosine phosphatase